MKIDRTVKPLALALSVPLLMLADVSPQAPWVAPVPREAAAIVGAPMTPVSVAGVARRTTARVVTYEAAAVTTAAAAAGAQQAAAAQQQAAAAQQQAAAAQQQAAMAQQKAAAAPPVGSVIAALPAGCATAPKGGVEYYNCGGVFYRSAFQGNNLVYVVVQQP